MLAVFSLLEDIDIPYKTGGRLYSDGEVAFAIHSLHTPILEKGVKESNATGDGTGYPLTIKKSYESYAQELMDRAKQEKVRYENNNSDSGNNEATNQPFTRGLLYTYSP